MRQQLIKATRVRNGLSPNGDTTKGIELVLTFLEIFRAFQACERFVVYPNLDNEVVVYINHLYILIFRLYHWISTNAEFD